MGNFTPVQRVQDAANDLTTATRFGRMDVAVERRQPDGARSVHSPARRLGREHPHRGLRHPRRSDFATRSTPTSR